jgi:hypothetical protein
MKKIIFLIFLSSCSFKAENNTLDVMFLNITDSSIEKYNFSLDDKSKKITIK